MQIISRIRELLYDEGFTVAGARKRLEAEIPEGRFDAGLSAAPSPSDQKRSAKIAAAVEQTEPLFVMEPKRSAPAAAAKATLADFPERKRVIRELKEIARLLERARR